MHLSPPLSLAAVHPKAVVLLLSFVVDCYSLSIIVLSFVVRYFVSFLVLQSSNGEEGAGCFALFIFPVIVVWLFFTMPRVLFPVCDCGTS